MATSTFAILSLASPLPASASTGFEPQQGAMQWVCWDRARCEPIWLYIRNNASYKRADAPADCLVGGGDALGHGNGGLTTY